MEGRAELALHVAETLRVCGELPEHREQRSGVQGRQPRLKGRGAGLVVQLREVAEGIGIDHDGAVGMSCRVPVPGVVLDAGDGAAIVVIEASVGGRRREEIPDVDEAREQADVAVDVDAEQRLVMHVREEPLLVLELEVRPQPRVQGFPERATLRVVVHALRVQEARDAVPAADHPRLRQEALVQVGLLAREQGVVLPGVQERLRRLGLFELRQPVVPQAGTPVERIAA